MSLSRRGRDNVGLLKGKKKVPESCCPKFKAFLCLWAIGFHSMLLPKLGAKKLELKDQVTDFMVVSPLRERRISADDPERLQNMVGQVNDKVVLKHF